MFRLAASGGKVVPQRAVRRSEDAPAEPGITVCDDAFRDHVVVVGYGRVGHQTVQVLRELDSPMLVVDLDAPSVEEAEADGLMALFGDPRTPTFWATPDWPGPKRWS